LFGSAIAQVPTIFIVHLHAIRRQGGEHKIPNGLLHILLLKAFLQ
jgi:hypothetical protein